MKQLLIILALLPLVACSDVAASTPSTTPPWALGDTLHVTGTLMGWAEGHAIPPVEGSLFGEMYPPDYDPTEDEGELFALGSVRADASFEFDGLCPNCLASPVPAADALCEGVTASDPQLLMAIIDAIDVPGIPVSEPPPPRPSGWVWISVEKPMSIWHGANERNYTYVYADRNAHVRGACDFSGAIDLDLRKGWNSVERNTSGGGYKTAAIPANAKWWFFNAYTASPPGE